MKSVTTFDNFPTFAENGSRNMNTESPKYQIGFVEADTFPAEWANYLFHGATKGVSDLNTAVQSIWQENINVITQSGQTPNPNSTNQLYTAIQTFINNAILSANASILAQAKLDAHPVGSLYWSSDPTDPSTLFGGTWTQIKDQFVWAKGDSDTVNATGGAKTVTLAVANLPSHNHSFTPSGTISVTTNPTFTGSAVTSDVNSRGHTHTLNSGNTSSSGTTATAGFRGTTVTSSEMSGDTYANFKLANNFGFNSNAPYGGRAILVNKGNNSGIGTSGTWGDSGTVQIFLSHTHSVKAKGYLYGKTDDESQNHTHSVTARGTISGGAYTFSGTEGTTGKTGSGTAVDKMPPYIVKYCWERTA